jgi:hypothetical protein
MLKCPPEYNPVFLIVLVWAGVLGIPLALWIVGYLHGGR